jgi:hypothetical protein
MIGPGRTPGTDWPWPEVVAYGIAESIKLGRL